MLSRQTCQITFLPSNLLLLLVFPATTAPYPLIELHVKLLRKLKKTVSFDRWEKAAAKFACSYSQQDCWEIERFGYAKISVETKLKLLKVSSFIHYLMRINLKSNINFDFLEFT